MGCADCPDIDICNNSCLEAAARDKRAKEEKELYDKLTDIYCDILDLKTRCKSLGYSTAFLEKAATQIFQLFSQSPLHGQK